MTSSSGETLALRVPTLEWSFRSGSGDLLGLGWADSNVDCQLRPLRQFDTSDGERRFRHFPYTYFLPPPVAEAAQESQGLGQPTAWEALLLLFARTEWTMASLDYLWTPFSAAPSLLGGLVESFGIGPALHRRDPDSLRRLAALLPSWHAHRGTVQRAREVLECCELDDEFKSAATLSDGGAVPSNPRLDDEVFTCHVARWWRLRERGTRQPAYRITDGYLRFQPETDDDKWVLRKEDVLLSWRPGAQVPTSALRLLPAWSVVRLAIGERRAPIPSSDKAKKNP